MKILVIGYGELAEELANGIAHKIGNKNHNMFTTNIPNLGVTFG